MSLFKEKICKLSPFFQGLLQYLLEWNFFYHSLSSNLFVFDKTPKKQAGVLKKTL
jgi:hypothetical protein